MYKKILRPDGSVVILVPRHESKSVTWEIMYKVGSRQERKDINGSSHFIEHLMFKGTKNRPTSKILSQELDGVGAEYNAFTSKDNTSYYVQMDATHAELGIDVLSDMLRHSKFDRKEMDRERNVIVEELNSYRDNPMMHIDEVFEGLLFQGSTLAWEIGGPRETIKFIPYGDLIAFKNAMYYPGNMVIGIGGNFKEEEALRLINRYLPLGKKRKAKAHIRPFRFNSTEPRATVEYKDTTQAQLMIGFPGVSHTHKDNEALTLLSVIMGGTMSSRLFIKIRERKGLVYDVRSSSESFEDTGYFGVRLSLDKHRVNRVLQAVHHELTRVKQEGITRGELARAKENIRGRLVLRFEKPSAYLSYLMSQQLFTDRILDLEQKLSRFDRVTLDHVNDIARKIINWKRVTLALIGPYRDAKPFLKALV